MPPLASAQQKSKRDGQHRGLSMPQPLGIAALGHLLVKHHPKTEQILLGQHATPVHRLFLRTPGRRQLPSTRSSGVVLEEFFDKQLLGTLVRLIEVLRHTLETSRRADWLPPRRLVGRAPEPLQIDETLHQHNRCPYLACQSCDRRARFNASAWLARFGY